MKSEERMEKAFILIVLRASMIFMLMGWISLWILKPTNLWTQAWSEAEDRANNSFFRYYGLSFAVLSFPVIALAAVGQIYKFFLPQQLQTRQQGTQAFAISSPVIVNRFLGIISCFEILSVLLFLLFLAWTFYARVSNDLRKMTPVKSMKLELWQLKYLRVATRFGLLAEACLALLLLPILRGVSVFQLLNIQFEASIRYHIWLGTAMVFFALLHGGSTLFIWGVSYHVDDELWKWQKTGRIYIAGLIALVTGLLMWVTSLPQIRRKKFEVFFYTHHLYVVFLVFFLFHTGDRHFYWVFPGIFLFGLDKILRIIQSTSETCVLAARVFPCDVIELVLPKDPNLMHSPSSIIFVKVPCISQFQWHPFSITSSSIVNCHTMSTMIKCGGAWTSALYNIVQAAALDSDAGQKTTILMRVEGPYGPASLDFLRYESLLLVAGGVGITPFLSILLEISCPRSNTKFTFSRRILLVFVVKTCQDISMLVPVSSILLNPPENFNIKIKIFITREKHSSTATLREILTQSEIQTIHLKKECSNSAILGPASSLLMAGLIGIMAVVFLIFLMGVSHVFMHPEKRKDRSLRLAASGGNMTQKEKGPSWVADLVIVASYIIALSVSSLVAIILQCRRQQRAEGYTSSKTDVARERNLIEPAAAPIEEHEIHSGGRPNFEEIISDFQSEVGRLNAGVLVCGPEGMKQSVASICHKTSQHFIRQGSARSRMNLNFHSLNFSI